MREARLHTNAGPVQAGSAHRSEERADTREAALPPLTALPPLFLFEWGGGGGGVSVQFNRTRHAYLYLTHLICNL